MVTNKLIELKERLSYHKRMAVKHRQIGNGNKAIMHEIQVLQISSQLKEV